MEEFVHSLKNPAAPMVYSAFGAMHTRFELLFVEKDEERGRRIASRIEDCVNGLEKDLSRHLPGSSLSALNRAKGTVRVGDELYFLLELSEQFRAGTEGYFDIAALSRTIARPAYRTFPPTHSVERASEDILLDLGGIGKGYAVERIRTILNEEGIDKALVNAGNSSVLGVGAHPLGDEWRVEAAEGGEVFRLRDSALSVSGRGPLGRTGIVNPRNGRPVSEGPDLAVTGRSALVCEILSTALYAAPEEDRDAIMNNFEEYKYIEING
ncbi:MAG: FAD:protein FMN transferase [Bacteroidales bacterium]|nr:FAD:protein FMN transferase [Bacteroidales bacterium]